jgi:Regulator of chromosome condensation (RCC1) repeat
MPFDVSGVRLARFLSVLVALSSSASCGRRPALAPNKDSDGAASVSPGGAAAEAGSATDVATEVALEAPFAPEVPVASDAGREADAGDALAARDTGDASDVALFPSDAGALPPERYRALAVATGSYHTCALLDDHRVKCWGDNSYGELGTGDKNPRIGRADLGDHLPTVDLGTGRTAKAISAGRYATCAILDDDSVKCWGWAPLAFGSDSANIPADGVVGDDPKELGDALPRVDLGPGRKARLLAVGYYAACVVKDDEATHCWGSDIGTRDLPPSPSRRATRLFGAGGVVGIFDDGLAQQLVERDVIPDAPRDAGRAVVVAGSRSKACVLWANGRSLCGGETNTWWPPELAPKLREAGVVDVSHFFCGILADGHVVCPTARDAVWNDDLSSLGGPFVRLGQPAVSLTSGAYFHFCAALLNGEVKCWSADGSVSECMGMGGSVPTATVWPSVDLGTRPTR